MPSKFFQISLSSPMLALAFHLQQSIPGRSWCRSISFVDAPSFAWVTAYLFGVIYVIQDLFICITRFLVSGACQMSHIGWKRINQSDESKRWQSLVLQLRQWIAYFSYVIAWLIVMVAQETFRPCWGFCTCADTRVCNNKFLKAWTASVKWRLQ